MVQRGETLDLKKVMLMLLITVFVVSFISTSVVKAEESISDYDNIPAEQIINDINSTINSNVNEGEIKYDQNYTRYRLTVVPTSVTVGQQVTAIAETDNPKVSHVTFIWVNPFGVIKKVDTVPVSGDSWKKAENTYNPDKPGYWRVFALFENRNTGKCGWLYAMRWKCFMVVKITQRIPDYPVVGTAGAITTMFAGLGLFVNKKRKKSI